MEPISTSTTNDVLKAPQGQEKSVIDLPIRRDVTGDGIPFVESAWQMTEEEKVEVLRTGIVYLSVIGFTHPPLYISPFPGALTKPQEGGEPA